MGIICSLLFRRHSPLPSQNVMAFFYSCLSSLVDSDTSENPCLSPRASPRQNCRRAEVSGTSFLQPSVWCIPTLSKSALTCFNHTKRHLTLLSIYCTPSILLRAFTHTVSFYPHNNLAKVYLPHFTDEDAEAPRG